jgi:uncharacterized protein YheU (UPF0270 family)
MPTLAAHVASLEQQLQQAQRQLHQFRQLQVFDPEHLVRAQELLQTLPLLAQSIQHAYVELEHARQAQFMEQILADLPDGLSYQAHCALKTHLAEKIEALLQQHRQQHRSAPTFSDCYQQVLLMCRKEVSVILHLLPYAAHPITVFRYEQMLCTTLCLQAGLMMPHNHQYQYQYQ